MNLLNKIRTVSANTLKCRRFILTSSPTVQLVYQFHTTTLRFNKSDVIANLCEKLCCTEQIAVNIYTEWTSLRSISAIRNDSLELLRDKVSIQSIVENPSLVTMDSKILQRKIDLLCSLEPRKLDDFLPLLMMNGDDFNILVDRLLKDKQEIAHGNRIYFLSEMLEVEPKVISKYRANYGYEIFDSSFQSFRKRVKIVLDYGVSPMDILNSLYALRHEDHVFIRRSERMLSVGLPIKMIYYQRTKEEFDKMIEKHALKRGPMKSYISDEIKNRNLAKATIVETLKSILDCDDSESSEIYYSHVNELSELDRAKTNVKYLLKHKVSRKTITQNGFLLLMSLGEIEEKLEILNEMQPKHVDDFVPLMSVNTRELRKYKCNLQKDESIGSNHPIYYFSEILNMPVDVVATRFAEKKAVFLKYKVELLKKKVQVLLKHNVDPLSILNYKGTFGHSVKSIEEILCKLKKCGIDKISSWMIQVRSSQFDDFVLDRTTKKKSLEGFDNNIEYIAHRLNWKLVDARMVLEKYPKIVKRSTSLIKEQLDYFLNETQFTAQDIQRSPYILLKNLNEVKNRINELTKMGASIKLSIINRSKTEYLKFIRSYVARNAGQKDETTEKNLIAGGDRIKSAK